ncbi:MAG: hypothetical protein AAF555_04000 [Verrucomicrobiota bacterium]
MSLLIDFGLCLTLWFVQLIAYPQFAQCAPEKLVAWHARYTHRIAFFVLPLMLGQLGWSAWGLFQEVTLLTSVRLLLILAAWALTFGYFLPLHQKIASGQAQAIDLQRLVAWNWPRTALWTAVFLLSLGRN